LQSSASSISGIDLDDVHTEGGGILVQEVDAEVDTIDGEEGNASGRIQNPNGEDSKKLLRESLRRTLTQQSQGMF
jgi:hypothetical protein